MSLGSLDCVMSEALTKLFRALICLIVSNTNCYKIYNIFLLLTFANEPCFQSEGLVSHALFRFVSAESCRKDHVIKDLVTLEMG